MIRSCPAPKGRLIITADDFGRGEECTIAIANSLAGGEVTAASIMANASHFDLACEMTRAGDFSDRVGVHLCLDEGPALSQPMQHYADAHGELCLRRSLRPFTPRLAAAVEAELAAQIDRVIANGIQPVYLDSHRHIHTAYPIGRVVVKLAKRYQIAYVRPARNLAHRSGRLTGLYKAAFNRYLASQVKTADYFGDILDFYHQSGAGAQGLIECMIHLDNDPRGLEGRHLLSNPTFKQFAQGYQLISHAQAGD